MSLKGQNGVLHTNSAYFSGQYLKGSDERKDYYLQSKLTADFTEALNYAEKQESSFYSMFFPGISTFEKFISEMRKIFSGAGKDGKRIKRLANANFSNIMGTKGGTQITEELEYKIIVTGDSMKIPFSNLESKFVHVEGGDKYINVDTDLLNAKDVLNYIRYHPEVKKLLKTNPGKYTKSSTKTHIKQWFHDELETAILKAGESVVKELGNSGVFIKMSNSAEKKTTTATGFAKIAMDYPLFKLSSSEVKKILNDPKERAKTIQEIGKIIEQLKQYIFNNILEVNSGCIIDGTNILKEAATIAWRNNLSSKLKGNPMFFFVGGNFEDGLKGQIGEFQLDIITQYTLLASGKTNPKLGHIIGGIVDGSRQQPRSDYQLIVDLGGDVGSTVMGIQVKNYKETQMRKVNINTDLGLIAPNLGEGFVDTIVNTQFNTDIHQQAADIESFLKKFLDKYFWKAMNLNVGENLNPLHTNTFYWMGGTAIVPASTIIKTIFNSNKITSPTFTIDGFKNPINDDEGFKRGERPPFLDYWNGNKYIDWEATSSNSSTYDDYLIGVKIHTKFNMSAIMAGNGGIENFEFF